MEQIQLPYTTEPLTLVLQKYQNGEAAIQLFDSEGLYATATVWVDGLKEGEGEVAIKDYSENDGMYDALLEAKVILPAHRFIRQSPYVVLPICYLTEEWRDEIK